jgi:hypothetical protein
MFFLVRYRFNEKATSTDGSKEKGLLSSINFPSTTLMTNSIVEESIVRYFEFKI